MPRIMRSSRPRLAVLAAAIIAMGALGTLAIGGSQAEAAEPTVGLGTATSFAVLAGSTVTNTGPSVINGDVGVSPGTAVTGFPPGTVNGVVHAADAEALQAQKDLTLAYTDAAGRTPVSELASTELGGLTLGPGVYSGATLEITGTLTLDAKGDPDAVFIFKSASTLITASDSAVSLIGSANPCNVFFQVSSSATLGTGTDFVGTILAQESITANTGATVEGRLLARTAAVTLDTNLITTPDCAVAPPASTTTTAPTTTVPAPTTTVPAPTTTVPAPTTTVPAPTTTVPAPTTTVPVPPTTVPVPPTTVPVPPTTVPAPPTTVPAPTTTAPATTVPAPTTTAPAAGGPSGPGGGGPQAPGTPGAPNVPGTPGAPGAPNVPGAPGAPGAPGTPGAPVTPGAPGAPNVPGAPGAPGTPTTTLARTGSSLGPIAIVGAVTTLLGALVLVARRRMTAVC